MTVECNETKSVFHGPDARGVVKRSSGPVRASEWPLSVRSQGPFLDLLPVHALNRRHRITGLPPT